MRIVGYAVAVMAPAAVVAMGLLPIAWFKIYLTERRQRVRISRLRPARRAPPLPRMPDACSAGQ